MKKTFLLPIAVTLFVVMNLPAQQGAKWAPVTPEDWQVTADSGKEPHDAVMIFEKVTADETKLDDKECKVETYRRIRICKAAGKEWANVTLAYDPEDQEIQTVYGRTILPDGTIIELKKDAILEKQIVRTEEEEMKEKFFSLPGVTDSCLIEYYFIYKNKRNNPVWLAQKTIPLVKGEYKWKFFRPSVSPAISPFAKLLTKLYSFGWSPNYMWSGAGQQPKISMIPDEKEPEEAMFALANLGAYVPEPFSLPEKAAKAQLRLYYGEASGSISYWSDMSSWLGKAHEEFINDRDKCKDVLKEISALPTNEAKTLAVYTWLQKNIRNLTYEESSGKEDDNENANDVIKHKYGSHEDINLLFCAMLKELGISAKVIYGASRQERLFFENAKYWQFDHSIVAVVDSSGGMTYYSPGALSLAPKEFPWFYEGTRGFLSGANAGDRLFLILPQSTADQNTYYRRVNLDASSPDVMVAHISEVYKGHEADRIRRLLWQKAEDEKAKLLKKDIGDDLTSDWKDSVRISKVEDDRDSLVIQYSLQGPPLEADAGGRMRLHPNSIFKPFENPFNASKREFPIMFRYAVTGSQDLEITLPKDATADILPQPISFSDNAGDVSMTVTPSAGKFMLASQYKLGRAIFSPNFYDEVRSFYQQRLGLYNVELVLKKGK